MKKLNLPLILDTLFSAAAAFLLFFTSIRYYTKSPVVGLIFGICAALLFGALGYLYISRKQNKSFIITRDEKAKKLLSMHLSLSSDRYIVNLFKSCFESAKIRGKRLICEGQTLFFNFKMQPLSEDDVAGVIKCKCDNDKALYCISLSPAATSLAAAFSIKCVGIDGVYALLKEKNALPEKYVYEEPPKIKLRQRIKSKFSRKLCAPLFWSGLSLLLLSYIAFFPVYYIISGGIMLILSAVTLAVNA